MPKNVIGENIADNCTNKPNGATDAHLGAFYSIVIRGYDFCRSKEGKSNSSTYSRLLVIYSENFNPTLNKT